MQTEQTVARPLPGIMANEFNTTLLEVPNGPAVNYLIGPRGATVSALEQASACRIDVQKGQDMVPGSAARTVTITHPDEARRRLCEALIRYKVVDFEEVVEQHIYNPHGEDQYGSQKRQRADYTGYGGQQGAQPGGQTAAGWWGQTPGAGYGQTASYNSMQPAASPYGMPQQAAQMGYAPAQQQAFRMPQQGPQVVAAQPMSQGPNMYAQPAAMAGQPSWAQFAGNRAAQPASSGYAGKQTASKARGAGGTAAQKSGVPCNGVRLNPATVPGGQTVILDVPDGQAVSYLIGTKGQTIIALQAQTGCRVDIQKARDMAQGCVFRQVTVTAPEPTKRNKCVDAICSKLGELKRINPSALGF